MVEYLMVDLLNQVPCLHSLPLCVYPAYSSQINCSNVHVTPMLKISSVNSHYFLIVQKHQPGRRHVSLAYTQVVMMKSVGPSEVAVV